MLLLFISLDLIFFKLVSKKKSVLKNKHLYLWKCILEMILSSFKAVQLAFLVETVADFYQLRFLVLTFKTYWNEIPLPLTLRASEFCMPWSSKDFATVKFFSFLPIKAKNRGIAIPVDLDSQVNTLFMKSHSNMVQRAAMGWRMSARSGPRFKEALGGPAWDYRNIIEKLQVQK